jgi:prefoldin alpha subunit
MTADSELNEKVFQAEMLRKQAEAAAEQLDVVMKTLMEMTATKEALAEIGKAGKGTETLVPLGAGVYVKASVSDTEKVFMGLGAQTVVEKDVDSCLKILDEQIVKIEEARQRLTETVDQINETLRIIVPELEALSRKEVK